MNTNKTKVRWAIWTALLLVFSATAHAQTSRDAKIDVGGYKLRIRVIGNGIPTVILEAGEGNKLEVWSKVQPKIAQFTRVLAYDRAGVGKSDKGPNPRSSRQIVRELHTLLKNADLSPPYVLVGHSAGGLHIRVFANMYPDEIAGMVFVDPTTEYILGDGELLGTLIKARKYENVGGTHPDIPEMRTSGGVFVQSGFSAELSAMMTSAEQARDAWPLPDVPIILLTAMRTEQGFEHRPPIHLKYHKALIAQMPKATHIITEKSRHSIQKDEPELVIQAIQQIVETARAAHH